MFRHCTREGAHEGVSNIFGARPKIRILRNYVAIDHKIRSRGGNFRLWRSVGETGSPQPHATAFHKLEFCPSNAQPTQGQVPVLWNVIRHLHTGKLDEQASQVKEWPLMRCPSLDATIFVFEKRADPTPAPFHLPILAIEARMRTHAQQDAKNLFGRASPSVGASRSQARAWHPASPVRTRAACTRRISPARRGE